MQRLGKECLTRGEDGMRTNQQNATQMAKFVLSAQKNLLKMKWHEKKKKKKQWKKEKIIVEKTALFFLVFFLLLIS